LITKKDVDQVALLGRLELTGEENDMYTRQLNDILGHFQNLERLDTDDIQPTAHVLPLKNVFREDVVGEHISREAALANCPDRYENFFKVPRIV
jgi:aspartyl-tRNA(Asn)/glutamyl-tRNA(Gln) amidotransferase subunit C